MSLLPPEAPSTALYVAYYRVSTTRQGESGLGLEAQRSAVQRYVGARGVAAEYTEIESGKRTDNRPQLAAALAACKRLRAVLVIAKLDRLARNVHFISGLMESASDFVACDMPAANKLTIHIMAAMAEHEREMISARTKAALAALKARGKQLGNPRWAESLPHARACRQNPKAHADLARMMQAQRTDGKTYRQIADQLNAMGLKNATGARWYAPGIRLAILAAAAAEPKVIIAA